MTSSQWIFAGVYAAVALVMLGMTIMLEIDEMEGTQGPHFGIEVGFHLTIALLWPAVILIAIGAGIAKDSES